MLTPRKRITKKQLKEDKFITYSVRVRDWVDENSKYVLSGAIAVVVILAAVFIISNIGKKAEATASVELANAMRVFESRDYTNAVTLFTSIVNSGGRTRSGKLARFFLAQSLYNIDEYAAAQEHFRKFASSFGGDDYIKTAALAGEAACLEQQGHYSEAAAKYQQIARKYQTPLAARYLLRAARCHAQAGNHEQAQVLYQQIIDDYPNSQEKSDALLYSSMN